MKEMEKKMDAKSEDEINTSTSSDKENGKARKEEVTLKSAEV